MSIIAAFAAGVIAQASPAMPADQTEKIEDFRNFVAEFRQEHHIPALSVALVHDGEIVMAEGFGWQDFDGEEPASAANSFPIASITKAYTAVTVLGMAKDGILSLDDNFSDWQGTGSGWENWTELCEGLNGAPTIFGGGTLDDGTVVGEIHCDEPMTLGNVLSMRINGAPGTEFLYNPIIFNYIGNYIEEVTGTPLRDWMHDYVTGPAGLENTAIGWRDPGRGHVLTSFVAPFRYSEEDGYEAQPLPEFQDGVSAAAGIIADITDLARFAAALDDDTLMPEERRELMWRGPDGATPYGYGWFRQDWQGERLVWHSGWYPDQYAAMLLKAPDTGWSLVALGNTDGIWWNNPLNDAKIETSPLALEFLETFVAD